MHSSRKDSPMGLRRHAREWALQFLFQNEFNRADNLEEGLKVFWQHLEASPPLAPRFAPPPVPADAKGRAKARQFAEKIIYGVIANLPELDGLISKYAENWDIERMGNVDRNAMRIAAYEMLYRDDIPPVVSINEAVELAKAYSSIESGKFVNGILDRIRKGLDRPARAPHTPKPAEPAQ